MAHSFDAVLLIAFGGPQAPEDIRPFLANVLRGRRVAPGRVDEVAHHYEVVGGRSPITELTQAQAAGLRDRLAVAGAPLPVFVGMRNWHPYLTDTLEAMSRQGIRRAIGFIAAAHRSYSSCTQYRENVAEARAHLARSGAGDYVALLAYIERDAEHIDALQKMRLTVRDKRHLATCAEFGPRFLHSTGQAYKGGPDSGVFLQITADDARDLRVPGQKASFGVIKAAQARGDFDVLTERGRRALRVHLKGDLGSGLSALDAAIAEALA